MYLQGLPQNQWDPWMCPPIEAYMLFELRSRIGAWGLHRTKERACN